MTPELWFAAVAVLQLADVYTTLRGIRKGAVEANPIVRKFMSTFGLKEGVLLVKIAFLIPLWVFRDLTPVWVWVALAVFYSWVLWHNVGVIRKLKEKKSA